MSSEQLQCFPVSCSTWSFGSWNPNLSQILLIGGTIIYFLFQSVSLFVQGSFSYSTMQLNWKLFPMSKLYQIEPFKSYMEATTAGWVDQLWIKGDCSSHSQPLIGKVETAGQSCGFRASSGGLLAWQLKPQDYQLIVTHLMRKLFVGQPRKYSFFFFLFLLMQTFAFGFTT